MAAFEDWGRRWLAARARREGIKVEIGKTPPWGSITEARELNAELEALVGATPLSTEPE